MELKYVVPNMEKTFGNLEFAGESKVEQQRINGRYTPVSRSFKPEQKIKLINPRITAEGYNIRGRGFTNYILLADDMLLVESK